MNDYQIWMVTLGLISVFLGLITIVFAAGGFYWLAKNHMKHAQESLDGLTARMTMLEKTVARIEGYCQARHNVD